MIPLLMGALGKVPWRLVGAAGLVAVIAFAGWRVQSWRADARLLAACDARLETELACDAGTVCQSRAEALAEQARQEAEIAAQAALGKAQAAEEAARRDAAAWRRKYQAELASNPDCAAWAAGEIKCPL